jgi:predicted nucleic acid-binding protein
MPYLLDTNVVSELRRNAPHANVLAWHQKHRGAVIFISVLVVGEIRQGIERARPRDARQAQALERWLEGLLSTYGDRVLPITVEIAEEWGRMNVPPSPPPIIDGLLAATARTHRLTLVTRNLSDFARTGVNVVNPFDPS